MHVVSLPFAPVSKSALSDAPGDQSAGEIAGVACDDPHCDPINIYYISLECCDMV